MFSQPPIEGLASQFDMIANVGIEIWYLCYDMCPIHTGSCVLEIPTSHYSMIFPRRMARSPCKTLFVLLGGRQRHVPEPLPHMLSRSLFVELCSHNCSSSTVSVSRKVQPSLTTNNDNNSKAEADEDDEGDDEEMSQKRRDSTTKAPPKRK